MSDARAVRMDLAPMTLAVLDTAARLVAFAGVKVFCLGLDVMGFRRFCEHTVRIARDSVQGTAYTRPETPAPDFAPHITA
jgi:hypothetical protein